MCDKDSTLPRNNCRVKGLQDKVGSAHTSRNRWTLMCIVETLPWTHRSAFALSSFLPSRRLSGKGSKRGELSCAIHGAPRRKKQANRIRAARQAARHWNPTGRGHNTRYCGSNTNKTIGSAVEELYILLESHPKTDRETKKITRFRFDARSPFCAPHQTRNVVVYKKIRRYSDQTVCLFGQSLS